MPAKENTEKSGEKTAEKTAEKSEIVVFIVRSRDSKCAECGDDIGHHGFLRKEGERGLCLDCADLGELVFLARGDPALTRRATKYSPLRAVAVEWSRSRKRYERQGILVTEEAIARAEAECLADADARERQRTRNAGRRAQLDADYVRRFAAAVRAQYPGAPKSIEESIAAHACLKYSGRVGRSAAAKELDPQTILLAVQAHIRHRHTDYDELLMQGLEREEARQAVRGEIDALLERWGGQ
jgi:hypothetical protein